MGALVTEDPYVDKNRWVINLSNRQLSEHETSALQNGLNYATTPKTVPTSRIVANIESGIYNLSGSAKATIRASVVNILRNSKPETTQNITRQHLAAVRTLQQDPTVSVVPADKGKAVVVMDTVEYREKVRLYWAIKTPTLRSQTNAGIQHHGLKRILTIYYQKLSHVLPLMTRMSSKWIRRRITAFTAPMFPRLLSMGYQRSTSLVYHFAQ